MTVTPLDLALSYKSHGWPVFPARSKEEAHPETGEIYAEKTPLTPNGLKAATTFERIIKRWWSDRPDAMVAVPTGSKIGAWVLDLDVKPGVGDGHEWLDEMEALHGPLPDTARSKTLRGGTHIFFRHVDGIRNRGGLGPCVDVRGESGYILAPGSVAADGRSYEWIDHDGDEPPAIADAPQWLLDLVLPLANDNHAAQPFSYQPGDNQPYVEAAVETELHLLATTTSGSRGYQLNASAFNLGTLVGAGALSRAEAEQGLWQAAVANGVVAKDGEREVRAKIKRGLDAGIRQPRAIPEREEDDLERWMPHKLLTKLRGKAEAVQHAKSAMDAVPPKNDGERISAPPNAASGPATPTELPVVATPFSWIDPRHLPRREFVYGTHLIRKYVSVTVSPGGIGKTSLTIAEALSMVTGRPLLGTKPPRKLNVWLFNAEDPRDEMERRIMAAAIHYGLSPDDLAGLYVDSGREQEIVVARDDKRGVVIQEPIVDAVIAQILRNKIDVMVIDPFVSTHAVSENDNGAIDRVAKLWSYIADVTNCAIEVVHHVRKSDGRDVTVEDARGAVSLLAAARSARVLNRMTDDQANSAGVPSADRYSYFSVSRGKANLSAMTGGSEWRHLRSVPLGNGAGLTKPQDHAGVVTEWQWPDKEAVAAAVPDDAKHRALVQLANQDCRENPQSPQWAGYVVAEAMGIHVEVNQAMTPEKRRAKKVLEAWIDAGILAVSQEDDPKHVGRPIKYIRPA